jgi:hypothetical protein
MNKSKKQPVKRKYTKKAIKLVVPDPKPETKDMELSELAQIISIFGNWTDDQKTRNIRFLASKYWDYLNQ